MPDCKRAIKQTLPSTPSRGSKISPPATAHQCRFWLLSEKIFTNWIKLHVGGSNYTLIIMKFYRQVVSVECRRSIQIFILNVMKIDILHNISTQQGHKQKEFYSLFQLQLTDSIKEQQLFPSSQPASLFFSPCCQKLLVKKSKQTLSSKQRPNYSMGRYCYTEPNGLQHCF